MIAATVGVATSVILSAVLQEKFAEKGIGVGRCTELFPEELLLHMLEQLCGFAVAELFSTGEVLQLALFQGCSAFD